MVVSRVLVVVLLLSCWAACGSGGGGTSRGDASDAPAVNDAAADLSGDTAGAGTGGVGAAGTGETGGMAGVGGATGSGGASGPGGTGSGGGGGAGATAGASGAGGTGGRAGTGGAAGQVATGGRTGTGGAAGVGGGAGAGGAAEQTFSSTVGAGTVRSYDVALWARSGHPSTIYQLDWSHDGTTIVTTGATDGTIRVFDAQTGRLRRLMSTSAFFTYAVAMSSDGAFILSGDDAPAARLWNATTGAGLRTFTGHKGGVAAVAFSRDGKTVATGGRDGAVVLWSRESGAVQRVLSQPGWIYSLRFSPDGLLLASASGSVLRLWDAATGSIVRDIPSPMPMPGADGTSGLAFSADGALLLTGSYQRVGRVFRVATGELVTTLSGHTDWVYEVGWNATGTRALTASWDGTIRIWDAPGYVQRQVITTMPTVKVQTAVWNPTADELAAPDGSGGTVRVWSGQTGAPLREITGPAGRVYGVAYSPDGNRLASGGQDGFIRLWNAADGTQTMSLRTGGDWIRAVAWSPTGDRIAAAGNNGAGGIWSAVTGDKLASVAAHGDRSLAIAWSKDGNFLATGGSDQKVVLQDLGAGTSRTLSGHTGDVNGLAFSPDGTVLVSVSSYREVKVWDVATGTLARSLMGGITGSADAVAFSPDGTTLAAAINQNSGMVQLWNTATWAATRQLATSTKIVRALAFSADGTKLATGAEDQTARVWNLGTGAALATFTTAANVNNVAFAPGGTHLAFGDDLGTLAVVPAQ